MNIRGWVYVIVNKAMPGLIKVGFSTKDPVLRAEELGNTGAPHPYAVVYDALVENPRDVEQAVHGLLFDEREGKEWFRCPIDRAVESIKATAATIFLERTSPEVMSEVSSRTVKSQGQRIIDGTCRYYGCSKDAVHAYGDVPYCREHFRSIRNPGRAGAIERIRQELKDELEKTRGR